MKLHEMTNDKMTKLTLNDSPRHRRGGAPTCLSLADYKVVAEGYVITFCL
jgi:hypothetical protein